MGAKNTFPLPQPSANIPMISDGLTTWCETQCFSSARAAVNNLGMRIKLLSTTEFIFLRKEAPEVDVILDDLCTSHVCGGLYSEAGKRLTRQMTVRCIMHSRSRAAALLSLHRFEPNGKSDASALQRLT